ncbi:hypothetical protein JNO48_04695 [Clostridiales bacterium]|jgi:hypothetical protein|nr:hypothetical protein [Paludibacteraceae bacterium]QTE69201.1 hypothetical protein JNO48_04695 [Clostridiales bacterium]
MKDKHVLAFMRVFSILVLFAVFFSSSLAESNGTQIVHVPFVDVPILETHRTSFPKDKRYAVYSGPSEDYVRAANGKAAVSTNDAIQAFASENGWIMIQYAIDHDHHRIGWIKENANRFAPSISELPPCSQSATLKAGSVITDDPLFSQSPLMSFDMELNVYVLGQINDWIYIESDSGDLVRGFVHKDQLTPGNVFYFSDWLHDSSAWNGYLVLDQDNIAFESEQLIELNGISVPLASIDIYDNLSNQLLLTVSEKNELLHFEGSGYLPPETSSLRIVLFDTNMNEVKLDEDFVIEW